MFLVLSQFMQGEALILRINIQKQQQKPSVKPKSIGN